MSHYYDRNGQEIDMTTWAALFEDFEGRRVAQTTFGDLWISTVWLGLDHSFGLSHDTPLIFETMVFGTGPGGINWSEEYCERYATEEEALFGHYRAIQKVAETFPTDSQMQQAAVAVQRILDDVEGRRRGAADS